MKPILTTENYFGMTKEQLAEVKEGNHGYSKEDNKILDEGLKVYFFDHLESIKEEEIKEYEGRSGLELKAILSTIDNRYAVIFS